MVRRIFGTLGGVVVAMVVVAAMDWLSRTLFPMTLPETDNLEAFGGALAAAPIGTLATMALGWLLAVIAGGFVAVKAAAWRGGGWIVALLILAACVYNGLTIPGLPLWMRIAGVVLPLLGGWIVARVARR